jgi:hypothetical protein
VDNVGKVATDLLAEAAFMKAVTGPAQRQAAHWESEIIEDGGPHPVTESMGSGTTPSGEKTSVSTTQAFTRRPCNVTRTWVPIRTRSSSEAGTT